MAWLSGGSSGGIGIGSDDGGIDGGGSSDMPVVTCGGVL